MELDSPFLFDSAAGDASVVVTSDVEQDWMELTVRGRWNLVLAGEVRVGVYKCVVEHPAAVLIDLRDFDDPGGASVAMWLAAYRAGCIPQPPVRLVMCVPPDTVLAARFRSTGATQYLAMFAGMPEARAALATSLPLPDQLQLTLPPVRGSLSQARDLVGQACTGWHLARLLYPVRTVMSELVTNAIEHAGTTVQVVLSRRGTGMYLAVRDGDPRPPSLREPSSTATTLLERGQGLHLVHATASAWGVRTARDGKVVWATFRSQGRWLR